MSMTFSTALLAVTKSGEIISNPSTADAKAASSLHVLAFSSKGHLLANESQGRFDFDTWESVRERAYSICGGTAVAGTDGDIVMGGKGKNGHADDFIRETVEDHLHRDYAWKIDSA